MKAVTFGGIGSLVAATATVGGSALAGFGLLVLVLIGVLCWIIRQERYTQNLVAILTALHSVSKPPDDPIEDPHVRRHPR